MNFTDLYRIANSGDEPLVSVERLRREVVARHPSVGAVEIWDLDLDVGVSRGHMILSLDRSSPYDGEYIVATIRRARSLPHAWKRYVACKELMHVFDKTFERTSDRARFLKLMEELETSPIPVDRSPMFDSEINAEWAAMLVLCPQRLRDRHMARIAAGRTTATAVAAELIIPAELMNAIMSDQYLRALEALTGEVEVLPAVRKK